MVHVALALLEKSRVLDVLCAPKQPSGCIVALKWGIIVCQDGVIRTLFQRLVWQGILDVLGLSCQTYVSYLCVPLCLVMAALELSFETTTATRTTTAAAACTVLIVVTAAVFMPS